MGVDRKTAKAAVALVLAGGDGKDGDVNDWWDVADEILGALYAEGYVVATPIPTEN